MNIHALPALITLSAVLAFSPLRGAEDPIPANLGGGLRELAEWHAAQAASLAPERRAGVVQERLQKPDRRWQSDAEGRVVVDVYLNGAAPAEGLRAALEAVGAKVIATAEAGLSTAARHGVISVYLPITQAATVAKWPGVQSLILVHPPRRHIGAKTSQGLPAMKVNAVQRRKFNGAGITIGVLSDSYDLTAPHAAGDVAHSDLPGVGNRAKHLTPVNVLEDGDATDTSNTDEGRAMLQIVHDVAPDSTLAFCTAGVTQAAFAANIRRLRTEANCDVLVDDIGFTAEPFFSDGLVAQAVEDVVKSNVLAGKKVLYYSAAGNGGALGYEADFAAVSDAAARGGTAGTNNLNFSTVPTSLTGGGFHNFTPGAGTNIVQKLKVHDGTAELSFQWNDLFDPAEITSDFNVLIFDEQGNYIPSRADFGDAGPVFGGADENATTGQANEIVDIDPAGDGSKVTYQLVIALRASGGAAQHFRYFIDTDGGVGGTYLTMGVPTIFGHEGSRSGDGVGAYAYNQLAFPEDFSSFGPVSIYFDDQGTRLGTPEIRQQPTISGPDGVATSMLDFRPFFGTSAAAPHVAAAAALLLQAAGGPEMLTPGQVRQAFQTTARPHDLEPLKATATVVTTSGTVTVSGQGDGSDVSSSFDRFFTVEFSSPAAGVQLQQVLIDLTGAGLKFDPDPDSGFPFTIGSTSGGVSGAAGAVQRGSRKLLLTFTAFPPGGKITFGIDRDLARLSSGGNSADLLAKGTVTATILPAGTTKAVKQKAIFTNALGTTYTPADGFGFVNVDAALKSIGK